MFISIKNALSILSFLHVRWWLLQTLTNLTCIFNSVPFVSFCCLMLRIGLVELDWVKWRKWAALSYSRPEKQSVLFFSTLLSDNNWIVNTHMDVLCWDTTYLHIFSWKIFSEHGMIIWLCSFMLLMLILHWFRSVKPPLPLCGNCHTFW